MSNLIVEYQRRHGSTAVPVGHDGLCFFDIGGEPSLIATTSLSCRSFGTCPACSVGVTRGKVIVETFTPGMGGMFLLSGHQHVEPTTDLLKCIRANHWSAEPFVATKPRDLEIWLWNFTSRLQPKPRAFRTEESEPELQALDYMFWSAVKNPRLYNAYYIAYEAILPKRAYLMYG